MSRASKALRNILTSKSSRQVWVATFNNIPMARWPPPCLEGFTEISYANLLYDPSCGVRVFLCVSPKTLIFGCRVVVQHVPSCIGWVL